MTCLSLANTGWLNFINERNWVRKLLLFLVVAFKQASLLTPWG